MTVTELAYNLAGVAFCFLGLIPCFIHKLRPSPRMRGATAFCCVSVVATAVLLMIADAWMLPLFALASLLGLVLPAIYFGQALWRRFAGFRPAGPLLLLAGSIWNFRIIQEIMIAC